MCPELFHIGPIPIRGYGLMLAISFLLSVFYVERQTRRDGLRFEPFVALAYIMIVGGVVGARLAYVIFHLDEFAGRWGSVFNPFAEGSYGIAGLNLQGGVILAVLGSLAFCYFRRMSVLHTFDYFAPTIGIGLGITRIGCFLNGCCFGVPTELPWGISFPEGSMPYHVFHEHAIHPTQLYSSAYGILLFMILHYLLRRKRFDGQLVAIMFMVEAVFRFAIEPIRYYESAMHFPFFGLDPTYNQLMSLAMFVTGAAIYKWAPRRLGGLPEKVADQPADEA